MPFPDACTWCHESNPEIAHLCMIGRKDFATKWPNDANTSITLPSSNGPITFSTFHETEYQAFKFCYAPDVQRTIACCASLECFQMHANALAKAEADTFMDYNAFVAMQKVNEACKNQVKHSKYDLFVPVQNEGEFLSMHKRMTSITNQEMWQQGIHRNNKVQSKRRRIDEDIRFKEDYKKRMHKIHDSLALDPTTALAKSVQNAGKSQFALIK